MSDTVDDPLPTPPWLADLYGVESTREIRRQRRERIATAVLASLTGRGNPVQTASIAVQWADALIAELDKEPA